MFLNDDCEVFLLNLMVLKKVNFGNLNIKTFVFFNRILSHSRIEAAVVRIMKARKKLNHNVLVTEVTLIFIYVFHLFLFDF